MNSVKLHLNRYLQGPGMCAVAAAASVANFYNKDVDYELAQHIAMTDGEGLYTPDIGIMLNGLGFTKVTIISADIKHLDFDWQGLSKDKLVEQLKRARRWHSDVGYRESSASYVKFLTDEDNDNELIIDHHFGKYIRRYLSQGKPCLISFNWHLMFNYPKWDDYGDLDSLKGEFEEHEVAVCGYDKEGVFIIDSQHELYSGKLAKYKNGRYKIDWETLHTVMGFGDLILPDKYDCERVNELV